MSGPEKFRPDEDEQLIELVHANPCLWNMTNPDFKKEKRFIWAEIGRKLTRRPRSGLECKSRWRSIRDYYKKQKKDEKNGVSQIPAIKRRQVYWNSLKFLDDVDDELNALSNVHVEISEDAEDLDPIDFQDSESDICEAPITNIPSKKRKLNKEECRDESNVSAKEEHIEHYDDVGEEQTCKQMKETTDLNMDNFEGQLKEKFKILKGRLESQEHETKITALEQDGEDDDIDLFFKAMAATVKRFPPKLKVVSKARIFNIINELEIRHIESMNQFPNFMDV